MLMMMMMADFKSVRINDDDGIGDDDEDDDWRRWRRGKAILARKQTTQKE